MMTKDFEPVTEVGIHQEDFGEGILASGYLLSDRNVYYCKHMVTLNIAN